MQAMGFEGGAYLGILTFVILPMLFLLGLALVPIGLWWRKRKDAKLAAQGKDVGHLPVIDLNNERTRGVLIDVRRARRAGAGAGRRPDVQGRPLHGLDRVLRHGLPQGDAARIHGLQAFAARERRLRRLPHRSGRRMVRQGEDLGLVAARRRGLRPVPAPDPDPGRIAAPGERHLRAVPPPGQASSASA